MTKTEILNDGPALYDDPRVYEALVRTNRETERAKRIARLRGGRMPRHLDTTPRGRIEPTVYDGEKHGLHIPPEGIIAEPATPEPISENDTTNVYPFPDIYDETNLPLLEQYKVDYKNLTPKQRRGVKVSAAVLLMSGAALITDPNLTISHALRDRLAQLVHLLGG